MRRRDFLRSTALAGVALGAGRGAGTALAAPAVVKRTRDLIVASPWRQSASGYSDLAFGFTRRLELAFGGRIKCHLTTRPGGSIDVLDCGGADLHIGFEHENVAHHAAFGYFAGLPGELGLDAGIFDDWLKRGDGQSLWDTCSAPFGIKPLMIARTAIGGGLWSRRDLPALSGKRIAAQGLARDVLKGLGAEVADIDLNDAGAALAGGTADAVEMCQIVEVLAAGVLDAAKFAIMPGLNQMGSTLAVSLKRELWNGYDNDAQALFKDVANSFSQRVTAELNDNDVILRKLASKTHRVAFLPPNFALETEIARVAEAVVADIAARDALSQRIDSAYMALRRRQKPFQNQHRLA